MKKEKDVYRELPEDCRGVDDFQIRCVVKDDGSERVVYIKEEN